MKLVDSSQVRDYWRGFVNSTLDLWVPQAMELVAAIYRLPDCL